MQSWIRVLLYHESIKVSVPFTPVEFLSRLKTGEGEICLPVPLFACSYVYN